MTVAPGRRLGLYEIVASLGAGGMGEQGHPPRPGGGFKVLPEAFASNARLIVRFEREARGISELNHPHICTLFDVGHQDNLHYLVLELLDGEALAKRLERGPLPPDKVLRFGVRDVGHPAAFRARRHSTRQPSRPQVLRTGA